MESQLLLAVENWKMHADEGDQFDVIYIDLKKAFEKVPQCHLLYKLCNLGLGTTVDWIKQFLIGRSQTVSVDKVPSTLKVKVISGVLQGLVLGPLLFNL